MKHEEITHRIIGCAMTVHSTLGNGFQEVIYQRALAIEMQKQGLRFEREMEMSIYYADISIGTRRVDFFVEDVIMVELKALIKIEDVHLAQAMNYCQAYNLPIGLLINFGAKSLEFKRVYNINHQKTNHTRKRVILESSHPKNPNSDENAIRSSLRKKSHPTIGWTRLRFC
jgi:GxxExxY protein